MRIGGLGTGVKLILVRHSKPEVQTGLCYGRLDIPACPLAVAHDAQRLAQTLPHGWPVRVSALARAQQLANALHTLRPDMPLFTDPRLNEMDFGDWEGRLWRDIPQTHIDQWTAHFMHHPVGGGESVADVLNRLAQAWQHTRATHAQAVWITHAGVINALQCLQQHQGQIPTTLYAHQWPSSGIGFGQSVDVEG